MTKDTSTNTLMVYESMFGNTEEIAQAIAEGLRSAVDVELTDVDHAPLEPGSDVGLLVVGGPTHAFSMSRPRTRQDAVGRGAPNQPILGIREWLGRLPHGTRDDLQVAVFDTRAEKVRRLPGSAAGAAASVLKRRGYGVPQARESFYVRDIGGPLATGELDRARAWGKQLADSLAGVAT